MPSGQQLKIPWSFNFSNGTTKCLNYARSQEYLDTLLSLCWIQKCRDNADEDHDLQKTGVRKEPFNGNANMAAGRQQVKWETDEPLHGQEFFFSNCMIKLF